MSIKTAIRITSLVLVAFLVALLFCWFVVKPSDVLKTAVTKNEIEGRNYILCEPVAITGYTWRVLEKENENTKDQLCNIIGVSPKEELSLSVDFLTAGNTYVFYVVEVKEYYSEELGEHCVDYVADGWDILKPVRHGRTDSFFESKRHITIKDTHKIESLGVAD
jgi:hypothetical protein